MIHPLLRTRTISLRSALVTVLLAVLAFPAIVILSSIIAVPLRGCV